MSKKSNTTLLQNEIKDFIDSRPEGFKEFELMKQLETRNECIKSVDGTDELSLFKKHFLIMNALYKLQDFYWEKDKALLHISATRIYLKKTTDGDTSVHLSTDNSNAKLKEYYLEWNNLIEMSQQSVEQLLDEFWIKYYAIDKRSDALNLLGLSAQANHKEIKTKFKNLAARHHPDKGGDADTFIQIRKAYEILIS
ncbi:MAG: DnaJ domain-containing protein [Neptuniibacter sp.]